MKKILKAMLLVAIIVTSLHCMEAKATEDQVQYGVWKHVEGVSYDPVIIPVKDKNTKIRIEITNMNMVIKSYPVPYSSTKHEVQFQWKVSILNEDNDYFSMDYGTSNLSRELKTGDSKDNSLIIGGSENVESFSFDIRITNLGVDEDAGEKTSGKIDTQSDAWSNKCKVDVQTKSEFGVKKIQLYRKDSKNGKYKLVKTKYDGSDLMIETITDKNLKPNKQYWYKIKTLGWYSLKWSDFSPAKSYWTCPSKVKGDKLKGNIYTWKKGKKLSGYIVDVYYDKFVGYNIFGQKLHDSYTKSYFVKGTKYKIKQGNFKGVNVRGYVKHNGRYYCTDGDIVKKKNTLKNNTVERYRK